MRRMEESMIRNCSLEEISDGRLYSENDMVKADTNNCQGCRSVCCHGMGSTIILDPFDIYRLTIGLEVTFEQLLSDKVELNVVDGIILPNLKMNATKNQCSFLDENKRCMIHGYRPGICRLFPLGRYWESEDSFKYILQKGQCKKDNLSKIKVKKWLDTKDLDAYNKFIIEWHKYVKKIESSVEQINQKAAKEPEFAQTAATQVKTICMYTVKTFFITPYDKETEFYGQFYERLKTAINALGMD